ncbi:Uncharacterised protein [Vibrio cholerae]|nr:Uncharacterised protein [Vibrio cholerae]CSI76634.1 Uncharacterised protein [Vibrio cholerae]
MGLTCKISVLTHPPRTKSPLISITTQTTDFSTPRN